MKLWRKAAAAFTFALMVVPVLAAEDTSNQPTNVKVNWFGSLRVRPEFDDNLTDASTTFEDNVTYTSYRARLGAKVQLDNNINMVLEGQVIGRFGEDGSPIRGLETMDTTGNKLNFFQAYMEAKQLFGSPLDLRIGRQKIVLGDGWLMGDLDFYGGTSWDGFRGDVATKWGSLTGFYGKEAENDFPEAVPFIGRGRGYVDMYGLWAVINTIAPHSELDLGILYHNNHRPPADSGAFDVPQWYTEKRTTYTARFNYGDKIGPFVNLNLAYQRGNGLNWDRTDYQDISANAWELTPGWAFEVEGKMNKVWLRVGSYSGSKNGDVKNGSFDPLFMDFHNRYGQSDFWNGFWGAPMKAQLGGQYGFFALQAGFEAQLASGLKLGGSFQNLRRNESFVLADGEGGFTRFGDRNLGTEASVWAVYDYGKNVSINVGFAQVYPSGNSFEPELQLPPPGGLNATKRLYVSTLVHF